MFWLSFSCTFYLCYFPVVSHQFLSSYITENSTFGFPRLYSKLISLLSHCHVSYGKEDSITLLRKYILYNSLITASVSSWITKPIALKDSKAIIIFIWVGQLCFLQTSIQPAQCSVKWTSATVIKRGWLVSKDEKNTLCSCTCNWN